MPATASNALRPYLQGSLPRTPSTARAPHPMAPSRGPRDKPSSTVGSLHSFLISSSVVNARMTRIQYRRTLIGSAVDREYRARQRFRVALHLSRQLTDLARFLERALRIGNHSYRQRHQWHPVENSAPVLPKEISDATVRLGILIWY